MGDGPGPKAASSGSGHGPVATPMDAFHGRLVALSLAWLAPDACSCGRPASKIRGETARCCCGSRERFLL